ncbi:hypothetical protein CASFOL_009496 [Castilleja foliolosa]|uniref:Clp R domain-containing protein n=1 Tax=Castilleja foliolosa TaxID=1961234 RepID=A0ABD3DZA6_9LAMI
MRAGGCALQQALTAESAAVVKQAVLLAKRRGHAQVTPLHVANTMLESRGGSFRAACLDSHSHPLQCKALELCFNVALNRLPASSSSSTSQIFSHSHTNNVNPSISNALVAAFKRAQAHQRRGSVEAQQQHTGLLAVKIELEQLVISILDDPSVSRVMREARFSSTQVKCKVIEKSIIPSNHHISQENKSKNKDDNDDDEVSIVVENLLMTMGRKKKSLVLVGECVSNLESTVKALMDRVDKGQVDEHLKEIKFITIPPLYTFCNLSRDEVEQKIGELTQLVRSVLAKGVVLYLGDFKWISDYRVSLEGERRYYCSVEHVIIEIGRLVWGIGELHKFWLIGVADFKTYIKCRNSNNNSNSLENVWGLHPVTIPANTLGFSLVSQNHEREDQSVARNVKLSCCADCLSKFEDEARKVQCNTNGPTLPSWLMDESRRMNNHNQNSDTLIKELCKKWNSFCFSAHKQPNCFPFDQQNTALTQTRSPIPDPVWKLDIQRNNPIHMQEENVSSGNEFSSNYSASSSSDNHQIITETSYVQKFKEFKAENLNILCNVLEKKFACHKDIIPEIAGTILQCRSGMLRRKEQEDNYNNINDAKQETWLLFQGPDVAQAKEKISKELAKVVFGSYSSFVSIGLTSGFVFDEEDYKSYIERFGEAVYRNPHRVFFLDDLEQVDYCTKKVIKRAIERGRIRNANGEEFGFCDAIIVLSCESLKSRSSSSDCSPGNGAGEEDKSGCVSLDLNVSTFDDDQAVDELGMFENVDRNVVFKIQDL